MNRKAHLVSSTPHTDRRRHAFSLFDDEKFSPIPELSNVKVVDDLQPLTAKPSSTLSTRGHPKRRVASKEKAAPQGVTAGVLEELGVKADDICNNVLSHSRNLYNMFPEAIVLDSDNEETSFIDKKPMKRLKHDSKASESNVKTNQEENKIKKQRFPGRSRLIRPVGDRKPKITRPSQNEPSGSNGVKSVLKTEQKTNKKQHTLHKDNCSVLIVDDDDDSFPVYQPGTSIHQTTRRNKRKEEIHLSSESDEEFPIEWSLKRQKTKAVTADVVDTDKTSEMEKATEKSIKPSNKTKSNGKSDVLNGVDSKTIEDKTSNEDVIEKVTKKSIKPSIKIKSNGKSDVLNRVDSKTSEKKISNEDVHVDDNEHCQDNLQISRFEDVRFKVKSNCGGIVARCLKTNSSDVGYLEVPASQIFNGERKNITFVVLEGKAKVFHLGAQQTFSPGDMFHIRSGSGYRFECVGAGHVRLLYIKEH